MIQLNGVRHICFLEEARVEKKAKKNELTLFLKADFLMGFLARIHNIKKILHFQHFSPSVTLLRLLGKSHLKEVKKAFFIKKI